MRQSSDVCTHQIPVFGCKSCVESDRERWAEITYSAWKNTHKPPRCPGCGTPMIHYGRNTYPSRLEAVVICPAQNADGSTVCEEHDITVVIG